MHLTKEVKTLLKLNKHLMNYNECKTIWQKNKEIEYFFIHMFTKHRFTQHYVKPFDSIKDKKNDWIYHNINYYRRKDIKFVKDVEVENKKSHMDLTTLILTMILICSLMTKIIFKLMVNIFSYKTETCTTKSNFFMLIWLRILAKFYTTLKNTIKSLLNSQR